MHLKTASAASVDVSASPPPVSAPADEPRLRAAPTSVHSVRVAVGAVNLALVALIGWLAWPTGSSAEPAPPPPGDAVAIVLDEQALEDARLDAVLARTPRTGLDWSPPEWFPEESADRLWVLPELDADPVFPVRKGPRLRSHAAIVADLDRGEVLYARRADDLRPVASLTKLVSALALASTGADLDQELCVSRSEWPSRSGARSRFETGVCHEAHEFLGAALVASDNRGAMGLATLSGLSYQRFLDQMAHVARDLRMEGDTWSDPSGLEDDNLATARDMLKAVTATAAHPALAPVASADSWRIERKQGPHRLGTTNRLVRRWETLAAKTGYTDTARYCFATVVRTASGRTLAVSVLGAPTNSSRFADTAALVHWAESVATPDTLEARATEADADQRR